MTLREARIAAGLSQQAMAERAGVALRTVVYAEAGRNIRIWTAIRFCRVLDVTLNDIEWDGAAVAA
jgi:DNA-binding XRE family transcriptional regulator